MKTQLPAQAKRLHQALTHLVQKYQFRDRNDICCYGISVSQCHTLEALGEHGTQTMHALAEHLHLAVSTVTRVVDQLVEKGLAERHTGEKDRRVCEVALTPMAQRFFARSKASSLPASRRCSNASRLPPARMSFGLSRRCLRPLTSGERPSLRTESKAVIVVPRGANSMDTLTHDDIRAAVRNRYGTIAETRGVSPVETAGACCGSTSLTRKVSRVAETPP